MLGIIQIHQMMGGDKGMDGPTKTDEFSEKFQTAFDPPPHFRKALDVRLHMVVPWICVSISKSQVIC